MLKQSGSVTVFIVVDLDDDRRGGCRSSCGCWGRTRTAASTPAAARIAPPADEDRDTNQADQEAESPKSLGVNFRAFVQVIARLSVSSRQFSLFVVHTLPATVNSHIRVSSRKPCMRCGPNSTLTSVLALVVVRALGVRVGLRLGDVDTVR